MSAHRTSLLAVAAALTLLSACSDSTTVGSGTGGTTTLAADTTTSVAADTTTSVAPETTAAPTTAAPPPAPWP